MKRKAFGLLVTWDTQKTVKNCPKSISILVNQFTDKQTCFEQMIKKVLSVIIEKFQHLTLISGTNEMYLFNNME